MRLISVERQKNANYPDQTNSTDEAQNLKGHSSRKFYCSIFSQKILTDMKTNFTKFELSTTFRY